MKTVNYLSTLGQSTYQDSDGMTPLHICAATKHVKVRFYFVLFTHFTSNLPCVFGTVESLTVLF